MIQVTIEGSRREFASRNDIDEAWVNQQIESRKRDTGGMPCIRVRLVWPGVDIALASASCGGMGGGGRPPNSTESALFELWRELGLGAASASGGQLVAFLKRAFRGS